MSWPGAAVLALRPRAAGIGFAVAGLFRHGFSFGRRSVGIASVHALAVNGDAVDQKQASLDERRHFLAAGRATVLITLVYVGIDVTHAKRDKDLASCLDRLLQLLDHLDGFASADPKVEVGGVRLVGIAAQGVDAAGKERLATATSFLAGFNPTDTV